MRPGPATLLFLLLPGAAGAGDPLPRAAPDPVQHETPTTDRPALPSPAELAALPPDGGERYNRLVFEKSPYLLQHAANPVDWYPWGEAAFARAKELDRPVFLSIGYSTCHWCHVMERESFEDEAVAALLNASFVCVKVDREERPDIDQVYMSVTQALTGGGGWPMTVVLTPEAVPFFAATYIPRESRFGRRGMLELVPAIAEAWRDRRADLEREAAHVARVLGTNEHPAAEKELGAAEIDLVFRALASRYDPVHGGFGSAPKFPVPHNLLFLLQYAERRGSEQALRMAERTLDEMRRGGIYDHVGFGFHRYSTDAEWFRPHFEKMLYDQALHVLAFTAAWQVTGNEEHRRTAEEVLEYVARDLTSPAGGFTSAEDADSEGEEGRFYLWTAGELAAELGAEEAKLFGRVHGVEAAGNYAEEGTDERTGANLLFLPRPIPEVARELGVAEAALRARLAAARERLFAARERRVHPLKDDKVLTDWNGLMIAAGARAGRAFGEERHVAAAAKAARFVLRALRTADGRLLKRYRAGEAGLPGTLDDHAFLAWGLLELFETTQEVEWLRAAIETADAMVAHFRDEARGGFYLSADDAEALFVRPKEFYDGAIPAGNSVAALVLLRLARITGTVRYEELAAGTLRAAAYEATQLAGAHTQLFAAVDFAVGPSFEVVIAGDPAAADTRAMLSAVHRRFLPHQVLLLRPPVGDGGPLATLAPYIAPLTALDGRATAYICRDFACSAPTTAVEEVERLLRAR
ncbi:MAG: thioredoxin domain-containing protein [Planctomycetota bacterium]